MKLGLACIAKNEDRYIGEWVDYHRKLGVDEVFIYQNDWRWSGAPRAPWLHLVEWDGMCMQRPMLRHARSTVASVDWLMVFDVDEFLVVPDRRPVEELLAGFDRAPAVVVNWRLFGSTATPDVDDGGPGVLSRFLSRETGFNRHVKSIVNMHVGSTMDHPHFVTSASAPVTPEGHPVRGPFNPDRPSRAMWLNHYYCKTWPEYLSRRGAGIRRADAKNLPYNQTNADARLAFCAHDCREVEDTMARDFMYGGSVA